MIRIAHLHCKYSLMFFIFVSSCSSPEQKNLIIPNLFSDGVIIQRDTLVNIWGQYLPNQKIDISCSWGFDTLTFSDSSGYWITKIRTINNFDEQSITVFSSEESIKIRNILMGEVWLAAGQSNMDGRGDASKITKQDKKGLKLAQNNISYYYKGTTNNIKKPIIIDGVLDVTDPWDYVKKKFRIEKCFGPELFFGIELAKQYPDEKFLFIKRSEGGTSL